MKKLLIILLTMTILCSCVLTPSQNAFSDEEYYYYSDGRKIYFNLSLKDVWIAFEQNDFITDSTINSIVNKYEFLNRDDSFGLGSYYAFRAVIIDECDMSGFKDHLKELNRDNEIAYATPIFYFTENDPDSYCIINDEVVAKYNEETITESDFIEYAENNNLELISTGYRHVFKVEEITTGFETLEIANKIYESIYSAWSHPNFIVHIDLDMIYPN